MNIQKYINKVSTVDPVSVNYRGNQVQPEFLCMFAGRNWLEVRITLSAGHRARGALARTEDQLALSFRFLALFRSPDI